MPASRIFQFSHHISPIIMINDPNELYFRVDISIADNIGNLPGGYYNQVQSSKFPTSNPISAFYFQVCLFIYLSGSLREIFFIRVLSKRDCKRR